MQNNILVTGGAGFIGFNFVNYWHKNYKKDKIIIVDKLTYSSNKLSLNNLLKRNKNNKKLFFIKADISNEKKITLILQKYKINKIINFAAETHVDNSISDPKIFIQSNIIGTFNLLNCSMKYWNENNIKRTHFHHISTDEVYGALKKFEKKFTEKSKYNPSSPYSASKASSDLIVMSYFKTYKMNVTISNTSNNFGPYINKEKLIPKIIINILNNKKIPIYGKGLQIREWIYVEDHVKGIEKIIKKGKFGESYNLGSKFNINNLDLTKIICKILDKKFELNKNLIIKFPKANYAQKKKSLKLITFVNDRLGHDYKYALNTTKSEKKLGFVSKTEIRKNLDKTIDWFLDNKQYWNE
jgi:dTDP-glucose 4,6-dehydratase